MKSLPLNPTEVLNLRLYGSGYANKGYQTGYAYTDAVDSFNSNYIQLVDLGSLKYRFKAKKKCLAVANYVVNAKNYGNVYQRTLCIVNPTNEETKSIEAYLTGDLSISGDTTTGYKTSVYPVSKAYNLNIGDVFGIYHYGTSSMSSYGGNIGFWAGLNLLIYA